MPKIKIYEYYNNDINDQKLYLTACYEMTRNDPNKELTGHIFETDVPDNIHLGNFNGEGDIPYPTSLFTKEGTALHIYRAFNDQVYLVTSEGMSLGYPWHKCVETRLKLTQCDA